MDYVSALLSMDSKEELPMDMVEQLLKFIPTNEERALLDERSSDLDSLSRADRFLYDVSKYVDSPWLLSLALVVFYGKLHCEWIQDKSLRAAFEHTVLQEKVRPERQRNGAQGCCRHGSVKGSGSQQEAQKIAWDYSCARQLHESWPKGQRCRFPHFQSQQVGRYEVIEEYHFAALPRRHIRKQGILDFDQVNARSERVCDLTYDCYFFAYSSKTC